MIFYKEKFRVLRKQQRLSITALSELTNISRQSISKWENGKSAPSEKKVRILAKALKIPPCKISDIPKQHPISPKNISEIADTLTTQQNEINAVDKNIQTILSCLKQINKKQTTTEMLLKAILQHSSSIIYLKDINQRYVLVSNSFLENLSLPNSYKVEKRVDKNFFTTIEALENSSEDRHVLVTGKPIYNFERKIFGSHKQRWGSYSKIPILDEQNKIAGILGLIQDITKQKKYEQQTKAVNYAVSQLNKVIWLGKGINASTNDPQFFNELIFSTNSETPPEGGNKFWGETNPSKLDYKEITNTWRLSFTEKTKKHFIESKTKLKFPLTRYYNVISPITKNEIWVTEDINYDKKNDYFIGTISFDLNLIKLNLINEVLNEIPNIIIWIGNICNDEKSFKYQYLSNTQKITEYKTEYFFNDDNMIILNLAVDINDKEAVIQKFIEDKFPFSHQFDIQTKTGKKRTIKSFYYIMKEESIAAETYYGFHLLVED